jgi:DNA primase
VHEAKPLLRQMQAGALRLQLVRELAEKTRLSAEEVTQLCELASAAARPRGAPAGYPRTAPTPLARKLLRVLVSNPGLADRLSAEQRAFLDAPELGSVLELLDALKDSGAATPAMVFEATRESQYAALYQEVAGEALSVTDDEESARADFAGALNQIELARIRSEHERLTASGLRDEDKPRLRELNRRMAELKGSGGSPLRPGA